MVPTSKGNDPERWQELLNFLEEKLQLGLLDRLRRVAAYHFEEEVLYLEPSEEDGDYLARETVLQQLTLLAQDAVRVERVKLRHKS